MRDLLLCLLLLVFVGCAVTTAQPICNITVVSYRFIGEPGLTFRFNGEVMVMPRKGFIDLRASRHDVVIVGKFPVALDAYAIDRFHCREINLGTRAQAMAARRR